MLLMMKRTTKTTKRATKATKGMKETRETRETRATRGMRGMRVTKRKETVGDRGANLWIPKTAQRMRSRSRMQELTLSSSSAK
jgi:hypothetical protein